MSMVPNQRASIIARLSAATGRYSSNATGEDYANVPDALTDTPERLAARMLCVGFEGHTLPESARSLFEGGVGFAVLFARNVESPRQLAELNASIKAAGNHHGTRPLICVDQEGGRVRRLRDGFTPIPSMRDLGNAAAAMENPAALARSVGAVLGTELRAVGIDIGFAPVLDVDTNPDNPVIADRSLGRDPATVAALGCALVEGIQGAGVAACGKHFPGHGDTSQDSHHHLPRLDHDLARLREVELVPFIAAARGGIAAMMSSHIVFGPLDADHPATLSPYVLETLLRGELKFDGVVFTDDMEMSAIASFYDFDDAIVRAIEAGADVITVCHTLAKQQRAITVIADAIRNGRLSRERIQRSIARIDRLGAKFGRSVAFEPLSLNHAEHRDLVARVGADTKGDDPTRYRPEPV